MSPRMLRRLAPVALALLLAVSLPVSAAAQKKPKEVLDENGQPKAPLSDVAALLEAAVRLPAASLLGAALAFRPRRRGTPPRNPPVIQTQILLAVVGALVMMVVGSSLARAFGIVGAAGLIRYRAKIADPKDAGVMLATLGVGLAAGVGLYYLAAFATLFFLLMLFIVESLDEGQKEFDLTVEAENVTKLRPSLETLLRREGVEYELRTLSDKSLCYAVRLPVNRTTDRISRAIHHLARAAGVRGAGGGDEGGGEVPAVGWEERKVK